MAYRTRHRVTHVPQTCQLLPSHRVIGLLVCSVSAPWIVTGLVRGGLKSDHAVWAHMLYNGVLDNGITQESA